MSIKKLSHNYYFSSFFWSTFQKILNAIVGFVSVPLLIGYYGKAEFGILGIATACNSYMHVLDLGMNTGAVKFFSQWKNEGRYGMIDRVARTNISFYCIIALINVIGLVVLALWGEKFFSVTHDEFIILRSCFITIAFFCILNWGATTFNQLLVANMQVAFTMQMQSVLTVLKGLLIVLVFVLHLSLSYYFFLLTGLVSLLFFPYAIKCRKMRIIESLKPAFYWSDFRVVLMFSISIFALSLFQMTAMQSRPLILSIFAQNGTNAVAEFRVLEVIPQLVILIGSSFSSIFLPKAALMVSQNNISEIYAYATKWTFLTTVFISFFCFPIILCASEVLSAFVGEEYSSLAHWLAIWCFVVIIQMHATPCYSLVIAKGKTKGLVKTTAISCILSIIFNIVFCRLMSVGSAIIGYAGYVFVVIFSNYFIFYKKYISLPRIKVFLSFFYPIAIGLLVTLILYMVFANYDFSFFETNRIKIIEAIILKSAIWIFFYWVVLFALKLIPMDIVKQIIIWKR